jgi:hypothetical protein
MTHARSCRQSRHNDPILPSMLSVRVIKREAMLGSDSHPHPPALAGSFLETLDHLLGGPYLASKE